NVGAARTDQTRRAGRRGFGLDPRRLLGGAARRHQYPLWAKSKLLGGLFMASGLASGSAGVTLQAAWRGAPDGSLHRLAMVESAASAGEMAILTGYLLQSGKTARPLTSGRLRAPFWLGAVGA